jgi:hypothetical protein
MTINIEEEKLIEVIEKAEGGDKSKIPGLLKKILEEKPAEKKINGVVIGVFAGFDSDGKICVDFSLNPYKKPVTAVSAISFNKNDTGKKVALIFQNGNPSFPVIVGPIVSDYQIKYDGKSNELIEDNERINLNAQNEIVLRCGKASITLTKSGKIIIRGKYILSRSSGVNKIKGGSVQIN